MTLIKREDAIEAVRMSEHRITIADEQGGVGTVKWDMWGVYTAEAVEAIKALPSDEAVQADDTVSRETYHNLVTASNDIDRALREYQDKEENGELVLVVRCKDCRQKHIGGSVTHYYWCDLWDREVDCNNYCSWAERKEESEVEE